MVTGVCRPTTLDRASIKTEHSGCQWLRICAKHQLVHVITSVCSNSPVMCTTLLSFTNSPLKMTLNTRIENFCSGELL